MFPSRERCLMTGTRPELVMSLYMYTCLYIPPFYYILLLFFLSFNIITLASHLTHSSFIDNCPLPLLRYGFASFSSPLKRELFCSVLFSQSPAEYMIHQTKCSQPDFISVFPNILVSRLYLAQSSHTWLVFHSNPSPKKKKEQITIPLLHKCYYLLF